MSGIVFSQKNEPVLEADGQLVKATYYYENGNIEQVGYFKNGKLNGKWTSYDVKGNVKTIAEYSNGVKSGKWTYFSNNVTTKEVNFSDNRIVAIKNLNQNPIADKN